VEHGKERGGTKAWCLGDQAGVSNTACRLGHAGNARRHARVGHKTHCFAPAFPASCMYVQITQSQTTTGTPQQRVAGVETSTVCMTLTTHMCQPVWRQQGRRRLAPPPETTEPKDGQTHTRFAGWRLCPSATARAPHLQSARCRNSKTGQKNLWQGGPQGISRRAKTGRLSQHPACG
jgi:hypothetical protein